MAIFILHTANGIEIGEEKIIKTFSDTMKNNMIGQIFYLVWAITDE